ncbi:MAG: methyltransferase domain-containing protein [Terriglobales bacterium]|jgi:SAM-dependent methyltransferase
MPPSSALEQVQRESRARLHPSLSNPNWLVLRRRRQIIEGGLKRLPGDNLSVLDVGGRLQPYRPLLGDRTKCYVAVDLRITPLVSVSAAAEALPFRDGQFDFVICTQVFEYLPEPALAVAEIKRVLRKGGVFFVSAPSILLRNSDRECWRFLPESWRQLLREFETVEVIPEGNSLAGFFRTCNVFLLSFFRPTILAPLWRWTFVPFLNVAGFALEKLAGQNQDFTANYSVWARK